MLQQLIKDSEAENSRICGKSGGVGCACVVHELCAPGRVGSMGLLAYGVLFRLESRLGK